MTLQDVDAPHGYTMVFEGQGGVAGFAKGQASVDAHARRRSARSSAYSVKAMVGGKIAQLGARLIDGVARKLADDFFKCFNERVSKTRSREAQGSDMLKIWGRTNSINVQKVLWCCAELGLEVRAHRRRACSSASTTRPNTRR